MADLCISEPSRVGIIASRRVGNAVVRNGVRCRLREISRQWVREFRVGCLVVAIAKSSASRATFKELNAEWLLLVRRLSILPPLK